MSNRYSNSNKLVVLKNSWYNMPKTRDFLMFSGGIERDLWHEMGYGVTDTPAFWTKECFEYIERLNMP